MKKGFIKYSDERNKRFSIRTQICSNHPEKKVVKQAIYEEGKAHLNHMLQSQTKLREYFEEVAVCKAQMTQEGLEFDFVEGELLMDMYLRTARKRDKQAYEKLLACHRNIICGSEKNACMFASSEKFTEWFGSDASYLGQPGLVYSNFDAIAGNIIMRENVPVFIDYEWTMDFVMPRDLVVYHCVYDGYLHNPELEEFYPFEQVLSFLNIQADRQVLEENYRHFFEYVVTDESGNSYAKDKYQCLKLTQSLDFILDEWNHCADEWQKAVEANARINEELEHAHKEWENCAQQWKNATEANQRLEEQLAHEKEEMRKVVECYEQLQKDYQEVINSKVWRANVKLHKMIGRG